MRFILTVHSWDDWPDEFKTERLTAGESLVDTIRDPHAYVTVEVDGTNHVHLRATERVSAVQHELWHKLTRTGNAGHHPIHIFWRIPIPCVASYSPVRFNYHNGGATRALAKRLLRDRVLEVPDV